jgi:hypothetical protein
MRQNFLKFYIFSIIRDGDVQVTDAPSTMAKKVWGFLSQDLTTVAGEIAGMVVEHGVRCATNVANDIVGSIARDIGNRGIGAVWADLKAQYERGAVANSARAKRGK